jgi:hypothetical protein
MDVRLIRNFAVAIAGETGKETPGRQVEQTNQQWNSGIVEHDGLPE